VGVDPKRTAVVLIEYQNDQGYEVITLSDCVAATSAEEHDNAIKFDYPMFSEVMTSSAFADELQGAPVA
jgi:nicotinamidase-related amidase